MKLATWNVNSVRARLEVLLAWLSAKSPDVVCLQETKVVDADFPTTELERLGYAVAMTGQKTYNGVAILSRLPMTDIVRGIGDAALDEEKRALSATIDGLRVVSVYVPNGKALDSPDFQKKLRFFEALRARAVKERRPLAILGDFNVAPDARDVYDPKAYAGQLHFSADEHAALARLLGAGLVDALRLSHDEAGLYSWWDYRAAGFARNRGLRLDLALLSTELAPRCENVQIDVETRGAVRPSDHAPVLVTLT